jgi:hypothetical protein
MRKSLLTIASTDPILLEAGMSYEVEFRRNASQEFDSHPDRAEVLHKLEIMEEIGVSGEIKVAEMDSARGRYEVFVLFPPGQAMVIVIHAPNSQLISVTHITAANGLDDSQKLRFAQEAAAAIGAVPTDIRIEGETP